jgi:Rod binding domain-containing protein
MLDSIAALGASTPIAPSKNTQQIKGAAQQFEALMIAELLKSARPDADSSSWMGAGEDDQSGQTAVDYAEQQLSSVMAKNGGIGLSKFIEQGLTKKP